ncbi:MAG: CRTAC1 family protein [Acidobacteria bacterium]|nr:CRTAC1 family protein [Acidobacteriota bacterium]
MSGGVALLDYDGDGFLDIYLVNGALLGDPLPPDAQPDKSGPQYWNRLYRNRQDGTFEDVTKRAGVQGEGYGQGVAAGDYDNDGRPDLYVTSFGGGRLYRNRGDGGFEDVTAKAGVAGDGWLASAAFIDYDADGDLDLFVSRYLDWSFSENRWCGDETRKQRAYCHPRYFEPVPHLLYRNEGDGRFTDVSAAIGLQDAPGKGLGIALLDADGDGAIDIFVANDKEPQQLFLNRPGGFEEDALLTGVAYDGDGQTYSGMGVASGDYDGDGWPDLLVNALALQGYTLYGNEKGQFRDVAAESGVAAASERRSGWGTGFLDFDNDGRLDLFVAQGHVMDNIEDTQPGVLYREPYMLLHNVGERFTDVSGEAGETFQAAHAGRGVAFGDLDNDGGVDIVINNNGEPAVLLRNQAKRGHWLILDLEGSADNRDGIGAQITAVFGDRKLHATASAAGSYMSSSDPRIHLGLGTAETVRRIEIHWPSGRRQTLREIGADQVLTVRQSAAAMPE